MIQPLPFLESILVYKNANGKTIKLGLKLLGVLVLVCRSFFHIKFPVLKSNKQSEGFNYQRDCARTPELVPDMSGLCLSSDSPKKSHLLFQRKAFTEDA